MTDCAIQTPLHFPPERGRVDPSYRWNEWDLRREALSVARQRGKGSRRTKAAQTAISAGSRNRGNQVCRQ